MTTRTIVLSTAVGCMAAVLAGTALASTTLEGVCATTGNPDAPYQFVMVDPTLLVKTDSADIFGVTSASQCPTTLGGPLQTASPAPSPSPSKTPTPTGQVLSAQTAAVPAVLPATGGTAR